MAGIQSCFRKYLLFSSARLINKNGIVNMSSRGRHYLICRTSTPQARVVFQTKKFSKANRLLFRLASTDVTAPKEAVSKSPENEAKPEATQISSEPTNVQSAEPEIVFDESTLPPAPEPELIEPPDMEFISMGLKEPSFASLGLGSWWPTGIIQQILEYLHINLELPWWQAILAVTVAIRICLFPLAVKNRKEVVVMMNNLPHIRKLQNEIDDAKLRGDYYKVAACTQELSDYFKKSGIKMFGFLRSAVIQGPIAFSMYYALREMAKAPVESLKTEGLFWFKDLTMQDPYYILPMTLSAAFFVIIEIGAEGNPAQATQAKAKWILRLIPLVALVFTANSSSCVAWYWTVSNVMTLFLAGILKIPVVRKALKVPDIIAHPVVKKKTKGFIEEFREGIENAKITQKIQSREHMNLINFQKAGTGPVPRTFKKNPLLEKTK